MSARLLRSAKGLRIQVLVLLLGFALVAVAAFCIHEPPSSRAQRALDNGVSAYRSGNLDLAKENYLKAVALDPRNKVGQFNLGVLAQKQGNGREAGKRYRLALKADPRFVPALFNLAVLTEATGGYEEAAVLYRRVTEANPRLAAAHLNLGLLLTNKLGRESEGKVELEKAVQLYPALGTRMPNGSGLQGSKEASSFPSPESDPLD